MPTDAPQPGDASIWIDWPNACVWRQGTAVRVTPKAWAVLGVLTAQAGQLVSKAALLEAVWPATVVSEAVLTECIRELRQAFGETARAPRWLQTVHRRGYRLVGPAPGSGASAGGGPPAVLQPPVGLLPPLSPVASPGTRPAAVPFVGRGVEVVQLHARLAQARDGTRHVVFITGEPGMGKTTLVQAFVAAVAAAGGVWITQGQCLDHAGAGEAYLPVLEALDRLCRAPGGAACLAVLEQHAPLWLAQLPALLSPAALEGVQRRVLGATPARMLREMADTLATLTQAHPLVLVLEDVHWSDAATLDLLAALAQRPEPARLLVLCTYRPVDVIVRQHPLKALKQALEMHHQCTELPLELFSAAEVAQYLAARVAVPAPLPAPLAALARTLHQRTDGHPLFLVTMVDDLVRQGAVQGEAGSAAALQEMPASLRRMITQWYEDLPAQDQQVLDAASVAGLTWSAAAVAAGLAVVLEGVEVWCAALARRGQWLAAQGLETWPDGTVAERYRWQHTLYQEVVYAGLPAGQRFRLHRRLGARLAAGYGTQVGAHAPVVADHFVRGQDAAQAVPYLQLAAQLAAQRYAYAEAVGHLQQGLALLETLPATPEHVQHELTMQAALGVALMPLQGYSAPEVARAYTRARTLAQQVGDAPQLFPVLWGLWVFAFARGELHSGRELGEQLLALAHRRTDPGLLLEAHLALGSTCQHLGEVVAARAHLEQALALFEPQQHRAHAVLYGQDPQVIALADLACLLWVLGYPDQARQASHAAQTVMDTVDHSYSQALGHFFAALYAQLRRDLQATRAQAAAILTLAQAHAFYYLEAIGRLLQGWAVAMQGEVGEGLAQIHQGLEAYQAIVGGVSLPHFLALLAEAYGHAGQAAAGLARLAEARETMHRTGDRWYGAELYRLQGTLLLAQAGAGSQTGAAEGCLREALACARQQQVKSLELRAAMSLSRLWQQQGKQAEARALLAPVYGWFTEGFDTADLHDAKVLLEELGTSRSTRRGSTDKEECHPSC